MTENSPQPISPRVDSPRVDEIPTQPSAFKAVVVCVAMIMLAGLSYFAMRDGSAALRVLLAKNANAAFALQEAGITKPLLVCLQAFGWVGVLWAACGVLGLIRIRVTYSLLRFAVFPAYLALLAYLVLASVSVYTVVAAGAELDGNPLDRVTGCWLWWAVCWPALGTLIYVAWLHAMLRSRSVFAAYTGRPGPPLPGDRMLEDVRQHGRDPRARRSVYTSVFLHVLVLVLIPLLLQVRGCREPYRVPKGKGNPVVAMVKMVKPKKKKKKTLTLRPNSAILFDIPDLDDTRVDQIMEEQTQNQYQATVNAKAGKIGAGGGEKGGWPEGMENGRVQFIRLEHGGNGWDDGMNQTAADVNFLRAFGQSTGLSNVANKGESIPISGLAEYPEDGFPPFVFLTGNRGMGRTTSNERKILREYCLGGGMLIADAGSAEFDRSFRAFIRQVFPDKPLLDIADDDMLYQLPFGFPDGAPAFWHHGGRRALGVKHNGRWIAFYHPGDMNDAWKSAGYSDVTPEMRDAAMNLGVNLIYYSFNQWNDAIAKKRK